MPIFATALTPKELAYSINLAGKERMLTQKMAKEALLIAQNIDKERNKKALKASSQRFEKVLHALMHGDAELNLKPCQKEDVQKRLQKVDAIYESIKPHIEKILQNSATIRDYEAVRTQNIPLLEAMQHAVEALVAQSKEKNSLRSQAINLAGKERMLTQKMAKALLENDTNSVKESAAEFESILEGLIHGDAKRRLKATKLPKIQKALQGAQMSWSEIRQRLFRPAQSDIFRYETVQKLDALLEQMDRITHLYEKSFKRKKQALALNRLVQNYMHAEQNRKHAINVAGRERMLTQKMTKEALLVTLGIEREKHKKALLKTSRQYDQALHAFLNGSKKLAIAKVNVPSTRAFIERKLLPQWNAFYDNISRILQSDKKEPEALAYLISHNETLLQLSDKLVQKLKSDAGKQNFMEAAREQIVDIAGRQRMLTQKMTKEKLITLAAIQKEKYQKRVQQSIDQFEQTLHDLRYGNPNRMIPKPTDQTLIKQLQQVAEIWQKLKPLYEKSHPTKDELTTIISQNNLLLQEMDKAVMLYEKLADI
jgi:hypothetical protein